MDFFNKASVLTLVLALALLPDDNLMVRGEKVTSSTCYCLDEIVSSLYNPTMASFVKNKHGEERIIVAEQRGVLKLVHGAKATTSLDIKPRVVSTNNYGDERGLLSAVPSPDFTESGKIYVAYTRLDHRKEYTYVSEFTANGDKIDEKSEKYLLRVYQPFERGNGGPMLFGDDGYLYIITGDGGAQDDSLGHAQNKNSFHGSVLRIDVRGGQDFTGGESGVAKGYRVPDDNPFVNVTDAADEIYAYGFRNMWGCSQDSKKRGGDGRMYCAETGTSFFDEINVIEKGKNYGWNLKEGNKCYNSQSCHSVENEALPIYEFPHSDHHALVGGYVYRGKDFTWLHGKGNYIFGDVITGKVHMLQEDSATKKWTSREWLPCNKSDCPHGAKDAPLKHILAFAQDPHGELYLLMVDALTAHSPKGKMFKMRPANSASSTLAMNSISAMLKAFALLLLSRWAF